MFGAIAGGIASALAGGAMSKLFGGGQKAASGGIQGDVLATDNNTVGMGDAGIKSAIQGSNVPNPDEAVPSFVSGAMAKAGKGLIEGTLQAGTSAVSDKLLDLVGLRSEERFSRNAETDLVCRLLLEKKKKEKSVSSISTISIAQHCAYARSSFYFFSVARHLHSFPTRRSSDLNVPNPDEAVPSFVSGAMAKAGKGLLEGTLQAGTSAVSDKLLDLVGLGGKSAADKGKDTRDYLAAAFPELNAWERAGADASSA